jgi:shikimate dehydrogenase
VLHRAAYEALGFADWTYDLVECDEAGLADYIATRDHEWAGLSLTMPLKRTVLPLLDHVDHLAAATGGANTVVFRPEGRYGYNTDVQGIVDALTEAGAQTPTTVTIIGAGATACSALAAAGELGAPGANVIARDPSRAADLKATADRLGLQVTIRPWEDLNRTSDALVPDLLLCTVPAGATDVLSERLELSPEHPQAVLDVVYHPWPTPLAKAAQAAGSVVASGFGMLLHQAAAQVELMTGKPAPLEAMREAGEAELARRAGSLRQASYLHRHLHVAAARAVVDALQRRDVCVVAASSDHHVALADHGAARRIERGPVARPVLHPGV